MISQRARYELGTLIGPGPGRSRLRRNDFRPVEILLNSKEMPGTDSARPHPSRSRARQAWHARRLPFRCSVLSRHAFANTFGEVRGIVDGPMGKGLVNSSGPQIDDDRISDPLIRSLFDDGLACPDSLSLGLDLGENYRLVSKSGVVLEVLLTWDRPFGATCERRRWSRTSARSAKRWSVIWSARLRRGS